MIYLATAPALIAAWLFFRTLRIRATTLAERQSVAGSTRAWR